MIDIFIKYKIKKTYQREQVYNYIEKNELISIKDILDNNENIDQSTVYRIINLFIDKKIIVKHIKDNKIYYGINVSHEHYVECDNCHKKTIIDKCPFDDIQDLGYKIIEPKVIHGLCMECQNKKIGIFVGSFNPPTKAHFSIGHFLYQNQILDEIVYVPCNNLNKNNLVDIKTRYQMLNIYCKKYSYLFVSNILVKNKIHNFSYKMLSILQDKYVNTLYIIIGADTLLNIDKWDNYENILTNYTFIVIERMQINSLDVIEKKYSKYKDSFLIIHYNCDISSSNVRKLINEGKNIDDYLDKEIIYYIKKNNLYKN